METFEKTTNNELKVVTTKEEFKTYSYEYLINQREQIIKNREAELAIVDKLIAECLKLDLGKVAPLEAMLEIEITP
jgi:hypothetical protein